MLCCVRFFYVSARAFMRGEGLTEEGGGIWRIDGSCSRGCRLRRSSKRRSGLPGEEREMSQRRRGGWDEVGRAILCLHIAIWYGVRDART